MSKEIETIKAALQVVALDSGEAVTTTPQTTVTEDAPLLPYQEYKTKPKGLPLEEYSLKPVGDLRRMKPIVEQLTTTTAKLTKLDEDFTHLRTDTEKKITELKKENKYEETKTELKGLSERAANEIQREITDIAESYGDSKKILLEYQQRVYAIYDEMKETAVSDKERLEILQNSMAKILAPELIKSVNDLVDQAVKQVETAKSEVRRKLVSWQPAKTLRKDIKEELPKKLESLKIQSDIGGMLSSIWKAIKGLFSPIKDTAAELQSLLETEVAPLTQGVAAAKTTAAFPTHTADTLLQSISIDELITTIRTNEEVKDEAAVRRVFDEILSMVVEDAREVLDTEMPLILAELEK